ncbi:glycine cleavage T C-terminal barrel domain-containing protein [uncultured Ruegeria sp.]|uniref:glycine cleavage T C-terminal barrel domain-containing protein n=1 Tax=uncultured Ruegeria sp. TaxID=259304 RepID=UPI00260C87AE|nr:glycine cleavage T C-terminal barrel domain-containing protein [uncultured Ruegeria sp.]
MGWQVFITPDFAEHVFEALYAAGAPLDLRLVGGEALNALRIEKGFLHWGHDMSYTEAPHQVGLGFVCKPEKATPFIGRDAFVIRKADGKGPFLCHIKLQDASPLLHHNEPVLKDGKVAGYIASGAYAYAQGAAIGTCFINTEDRATVTHGAFAVMVKGQAVPATVSLHPFSKPQLSNLSLNTSQGFGGSEFGHYPVVSLRSERRDQRLIIRLPMFSE